MQIISLEDRALGALLGVAVGDALGAPAEFSTAGQVSRLGGGRPLREMVGGGVRKVKPGEITDDTEMTIALCRALLDGDDYRQQDAMRHYLAWYRSGPSDIGNTVASALAEATRAADPVAAGILASEEVFQRTGRAAGNGALMRCAPLGLRYLRDGERRAEVARLDAALTHGDPLVGHASVAYLDLLQALLQAQPRPAVAAGSDLAAALQASAQRAGEWTRTETGFVLASLAVASVAIRAPSFEEGVVWAVNQLGDPDTDGAIAGALLGARFGASGIPTRWITALDSRVVDELSDAADRLVAASTADSGG
jgi:ADP-ribosyl-[dinitrogen reductase] hydrolase